MLTSYWRATSPCTAFIHPYTLFMDWLTLKTKVMWCFECWEPLTPQHSVMLHNITILNNTTVTTLNPAFRNLYNHHHRNVTPLTSIHLQFTWRIKGLIQWTGTNFVNLKSAYAIRWELLDISDGDSHGSVCVSSSRGPILVTFDACSLL